MSVDRERAELEAEIRTAFADVTPAGRISLREAYRIDHDGGEPKIDWNDSDTTWSEIPPDVLEFFASATSVFIFGNIESFRYYLPAYMIHTLRTGSSVTIHALDLKGAAPDELPQVVALDAAQRRAVVRFLRFYLQHEGPDRIAERALDRVWRHVKLQ